ncbi:metal-dependent phosphohydrolase [Planctomycetales bacterium]|nr:metal-dependent phosphohydrolase [Planctomycetales bacterium]
MPSSYLARAYRAYDEYVAGFRDANGALLEMQQLKLDHSRRVAQIARDLAAAEKWRAADLPLAEIAGLYHDIGRYAQYRDYRTFQDRHSVNHGELGDEIIAAGVLAFLPPDELATVRVATRHHNARDLPTGLPARQLRFLQLDRDSDKIDIYATLTGSIKDQLHLKYPELLHGVDPDGPAAAALIDRVLRGEKIGALDAKSLSDFLVVSLQWIVNGFSFPASYRLLKERRVLAAVAEVIKMSPKVEELLRFAERRIEEQLTN